jgi:hypothetical protein
MEAPRQFGQCLWNSQHAHKAEPKQRFTFPLLSAQKAAITPLHRSRLAAVLVATA